MPLLEIALDHRNARKLNVTTMNRGWSGVRDVEEVEDLAAEEEPTMASRW